MRILLTATVQSHIVQFHRPLVEVLHAHGCEVHVAARDNLAEKNGLKLDFVERIYNIPFARSPKSTDNLNAYKQLKRIIDEGNYDVVHCNTPMGGIVTRLSAKDARKKGTKVFYTAHGFHFYKGAPKKNWIIFYPIEKYFADHFTDKLITITDEDYKLARNKFHCQVERIHGVGVDEKRYYPVDTIEEQRLRKEMGYTSNQKILLCVGELLPNKNQQMAIHAMREVVKKYPDAVLLLAGNGPRKEYLETEIVNAGLENNVKMLGYCTCLEKYLHIVDILIACSYREGLPMNVMEAMASRKTVIATHNRGHNELITDNVCGYLVNPDDVGEFSKIILEVLDNDEINKRLSKEALKRSKLYMTTNVSHELEKIYFITRPETSSTIVTLFIDEDREDV